MYGSNAVLHQVELSEQRIHLEHPDVRSIQSDLVRTEIKDGNTVTDTLWNKGIIPSGEITFDFLEKKKNRNVLIRKNSNRRD